MGGPPGRDGYLAGHLPGATWTDLETDLAGPPGTGGRHPLPSPADAEAAMRRLGVSDGRSVVYALNRGVPFFLSNREAQVSQDVLRLASAVAGNRATEAGDPAKKSAQKKSLFAWR